jgi:hypothetical protein
VAQAGPGFEPDEDPIVIVRTQCGGGAAALDHPESEYTFVITNGVVEVGDLQNHMAHMSCGRESIRRWEDAEGFTHDRPEPIAGADGSSISWWSLENATMTFAEPAGPSPPV